MLARRSSTRYCCTSAFPSLTETVPFHLHINSFTGTMEDITTNVPKTSKHSWNSLPCEIKQLIIHHLLRRIFDADLLYPDEEVFSLIRLVDKLGMISFSFSHDCLPVLEHASKAYGDSCETFRTWALRHIRESGEYDRQRNTIYAELSARQDEDHVELFLKSSTRVRHLLNHSIETLKQRIVSNYSDNSAQRRMLIPWLGSVCNSRVHDQVCRQEWSGHTTDVA